MIPSATNSLTAGLQRNTIKFTSAAQRIADPNQNLDVGDLAKLKKAANAFKTNAAALAIVNETTDHLLDIVV